MGYNAWELKGGKEVPVIYDTLRLINGHVFIVGKSGTGKTHLLREMIRQLSAQTQGRLRVHVFDVHGDIEIEGASVVRFSEATPYGFNPLVVNPDPDFGGVRKRVQSFVAALKRTGYGPGAKQEAALRNILLDLYAANGFYEDKPESWRLDDGVSRARPKRFPTMDDAVRFTNYKLREMYLGTSSKAVESLEKFYRKQGQFYTRIKRLGRETGADLDDLKADLKKRAEESVDLFKEHLDQVQTGHELDDLIKYDSKDVMKGLADRMENLRSIGIFRPERPPFDPRTPIWRYDIKALASKEKQLFVNFLLESIYLGAVQRGMKNDVVEIVVLDEAHLFFNDDPENPINTIAKEARKFGLGLFCASQSPTHFSDDFISNVGTKIILGIDQMYWEGTVRKMKIELKDLEWIRPQQQIVMQMNNKGDTRNRFTYVALRK